MDDRELADKAVKLLGYDNDSDEICAATYYTIPETDDKDAAGFVRDPRVAMALLNLVRAQSVQAWCCICRDMMHLNDVKSLPRAITEACVESLT